MAPVFTMFAFFVGMFFGFLIRSRTQDEMNRSQQQRGDYWFERCREVQRKLEQHGEDWKE